jgi:probable phosphoglycerate mutase
VITFARHGQTALNQGGRLQGRIDAPLSDLGRAQARALADALRSEGVMRVVSSPLARARDTAAAIANAHGIAVDVDDRLIELDYGEWDGIALGDVLADDWKRWRADPSFTPPGGESLIAVTERVASFCRDAFDAGGDIVAVSHVSPIKAAVAFALAVDEQITWRMQLGVASITRISARADGNPHLLSFNETLHLANVSASS